MLSLSEPRCGFRLWRSHLWRGVPRSDRNAQAVFFTGGFIIACLTFGDELLGFALKPAAARNAPQLVAPEIAFVSPEAAPARRPPEVIRLLKKQPRAIPDGPDFRSRVAPVSGNGDSTDHPRAHQQRICG
jgi:hypothetical protein